VLDLGCVSLMESFQADIVPRSCLHGPSPVNQCPPDWLLLTRSMWMLFSIASNTPSRAPSSTGPSLGNAGEVDFRHVDMGYLDAATALDGENANTKVESRSRRPK